jgi:hypothetical protein
MTAPEIDKALFLDALKAIHEAIRIPFPATYGDAEIYGEILETRVMHAAHFISAFLTDENRQQADDWRQWHIAYLRDRLAESPPIGYRHNTPLSTDADRGAVA